MRVLLLGGTRQAEALAQALARLGADAVLSLRHAPGHTDPPAPLPCRSGGFGGVAGLVAYLSGHAITHVIDATDAFATAMSRHAFIACARQDLPLVRLEPMPWVAQPGDNWTLLPEAAMLPAALPDSPARIFLAVDPADLDVFVARPQHRYLLRLSSPPGNSLSLPRATVIVASGPFEVPGEAALMRTHAITHVVTKNSGGISEGAKLVAARSLGLPVLMAQRPALPGTAVARDTAEALHWLHRTRRPATG